MAFATAVLTLLREKPILKSFLPPDSGAWCKEWKISGLREVEMNAIITGRSHSGCISQMFVRFLASGRGSTSRRNVLLLLPRSFLSRPLFLVFRVLWTPIRASPHPLHRSLIWGSSAHIPIRLRHFHPHTHDRSLLTYTLNSRTKISHHRFAHLRPNFDWVFCKEEVGSLLDQNSIHR